MAARRVLLDRALTGVLVVANAILLNIIALRHVHGRVDLTEGKENTLSQGTLHAIEKLPDRARVRAYVSRDLPPEAAPTLQPVIDLIGQIERASRGKVAVEWLDPTNYEVVAAARKLGINPVELQLNRADNLVQSSIYFGLEVRCADRPPKVIPFIDFRNPEYEIATAFASLAGEKTIAFLTREPGAPPKFPGFNMPTPPERIFEGLREKLRSLYKVIDLGNTKYGDPIPDEVDVLVLGRPTELTERERFEIDQFLMRGGRILVLYDTQVYETGSGGITHKTVHTGMEPLLAKWGIAIPDDVLVVDRMCETVRVTRNTPVGPRQQQIQYPYFPAVSKLTGGLSTNHPITKVLQGVSLFWCDPIDTTPDRPAGVTIENLIQSSERSFRTREIDNVNIDDQLTRRILEKVVSHEEARQKLAVALVGKFPSLFSGKPVPPPSESRPATMAKPFVDDSKREVAAESKESRIVVVGDSDFATNDFIRSGQTSAVLAENIVEWLALEQDLTSIRGRGQVRRLRNLEVEATKGKTKDANPRLTASNPSDMQAEITKYFEDQERVSLEGREAAERTRLWIKFGNVLGPGLALVAFGLLRLWLHARERARLAAFAKGVA